MPQRAYRSHLILVKEMCRKAIYSSTSVQRVREGLHVDQREIMQNHHVHSQNMRGITYPQNDSKSIRFTREPNAVTDSIGFFFTRSFYEDLHKSIRRNDYPSNLIDSIHKFNNTFSTSQKWDSEMTRYCQVSEEAMYVIITISESGWVKIELIESS